MTTTTDEDALLAAIIANPNDDTPRMVYADWLDEHGEADRAEFIRDCCNTLARHTDCPVRLADLKSGRPVPLRCGGCDYCTARRRAERFYAGHQWVTGVPYAVCFEPTPLDGGVWSGPGLTLVVRRGFVEEVRCTAADWLRHADALAWSPGATGVCPNCDGFGGFTRKNFDGPSGPCPDCGGQWEPRDDEYDRGWSPGAGLVPRPCPPTAQPIRKVTLTTNPLMDSAEIDADNPQYLPRTFWRDETIKDRVVWRHIRWPWIEFTYTNQPT